MTGETDGSCQNRRDVADGLKTRVFPYLGLPKIFSWITGINSSIKLVREVDHEWGGDDVLFVNCRPRHSQSQGLVERGNCTLETKLRSQYGYDGVKKEPLDQLAATNTVHT